MWLGGGGGGGVCVDSNVRVVGVGVGGGGYNYSETVNNLIRSKKLDEISVYVIGEG